MKSQKMVHGARKLGSPGLYCLKLKTYLFIYLFFSFEIRIRTIYVGKLRDTGKHKLPLKYDFPIPFTYIPIHVPGRSAAASFSESAILGTFTGHKTDPRRPKKVQCIFIAHTLETKI